MHFVSDYGLFLLKTITLVVAILATMLGIIALASKTKEESRLSIKKLNKKYQGMSKLIKAQILDKKTLKHYLKDEKNLHKKQEGMTRRKVYVIHFHGDIKATAVESMRQEISAVLTVATAQDEVIVTIESSGGMVNTYGLAASQLQRIRDKRIPLTVCVDKVAASGGYLMACVADKILAAPFAIIGSIGVVAQLPNFNRLLKKKNIDFEMLTAGEYKRTLTIFGENTDKGRRKFVEDLEEIHTIFKNYISEHRSQVDITRVATGEHWLATKAFELKLVDNLITSDDYLMKACNDADVFEISYKKKKNLTSRLSESMTRLMGEVINPRQY